MTDVAPSHPALDLQRAQTQARTIRSWIHRHNPAPLDPQPDSVVWVMGVFDELDRCINNALHSANHHLPWTADLQAKQHRDERARSGLNRHRLKVAEDTTTGIARWVNAARWSDGVKPGDLDKLESLTRRLAEHLSHLTAQAQEQELDR